jgi:hypothetical protein
MDAFKKKAIALSALPLALFFGAAFQSSPSVPDQLKAIQSELSGLKPRKFYLTRTEHDGAHALSACAAGYHMASLWEILEPSNLRYDTELGFTQDDSGFGPPSGALSSNTVGWIRTGQSANFSTSLGEANCNAWTSGSDVESAAGAGLNSNWISTNVLVVSPWAFIRFSCDSSVRVWCVQN